MRKTIFRERTLFILLFLALVIRIFSASAHWVEHYYSTALYPFLSACLRTLFGWIPFSLGDLLYITTALYLLYQAFTFFSKGKFRRWKQYLLWIRIRKWLAIVLYVYILFNLLWGLNYNRQGISAQLTLKLMPYTTADLITLTNLLRQKLNQSAAKIDSTQRCTLNNNSKLFIQGINAYTIAKDSFPFIHYTHASIKPSMISHIAKYFGFTGYYNPFSGEAQIKTTVPVFIKPFILTHEMAHQLGYAKENEANFVGYLACKNATDINFRYSVYFELTLYALSDLRSRDSIAAKNMKINWSSRVKYDYKDLVDYLQESRNPVEPIIMRFYDQYLKMNSQPKGNKTYNEVIAWLIAYMKKYGPQAV